MLAVPEPSQVQEQPFLAGLFPFLRWVKLLYV
jgi:hypothetical protein